MTTHLSVFTEYRGYLFSLAQRVLGSRADAEDLLQETFIRFEVSPEQLQKLARQFALTCASGDLKGLMTALA